MNYHVKFKTFERSFDNVKTYKQFKKDIRKGFKFVLDKDFNLYYFDAEGDKITMSSQDDFINSQYEPTNDLELFLETNEEELEASDDSFEQLSRSVAQHVESYRKLSNSINQKENEHQVQIEDKKLNEQGNELQKNQSENTQQKTKSILLINQTIQDLEIQIKILQIREQENKIKKKLDSVVFPVSQNVDLGAQILQLPEIQEIDEMEKQYINLNKVEKSQLQKKYYNLNLNFKQLISNINKGHNAYSTAYKEAFKQKTKYEANLQKIQKKTDQKIEELNQVISKLKEKLEHLTTVVVTQEQEQQSLKEVELFLDSITKLEIQEKKQKSIHTKVKKQAPRLEDLINLDSDNDIE